MSTLQVTTIETGTVTTDLTVQTGNTNAGEIIIRSGGGMNLHSNSTFAALNVGTGGNLIVGNNISGKFTGNTVLIRETVYTSNGTHTKVGNLVSMMVYCVGAGGAGGTATGAATGTGAVGAAGGGGGGAAMKILLNTEVGATSNVTVGIGSTGSGSNSTFANSTNGLITGQGGTAASTTTPGTGGPAINGDINIPGADGSQGTGTGVSLAVSVGGAGGHSGLGFGYGGGAVRSNATGSAGDLYGGGGAGGAQGNTAATVTGGNGANGVVWVVEYYNGV